MRSVLILVLGCGDKSDDTSRPTSTETGSTETGSTETGTPDTDAPDCAEVTAEECGERPDCLTVEGRPAQATDDGFCVEYAATPTAHDCQDGKGGCGDIPYLAVPADDPSVCWWFPNTCIPDGWVLCGDYDKWPECPSQ